MKKVFLLILIFILFSTFTASAGYIADINFDNGNITVKGSLSEAKAGRMVFISVLKPGESTENIKLNDNSIPYVIETDSEGAFEYTLNIDAASISTTDFQYNLVIGAYDLTNKIIEPFFLCPSIQIMPVVSQIASAATGAQISDLFRANSNILGFVNQDLDTLPANNKNSVYDGLALKTSFADVEEFKLAFYSFYVPEKISTFSDGAQTEALISKFDRYVKLSQMQNYSDFFGLEPTAKSSVYAYLAGKPCHTLSDLEQNLNKGTFLQLMKATQNISQVQQVLSKYASKLSLNLTSVTSLNEPGKVYADMAGALS